MIALYKSPHHFFSFCYRKPRYLSTHMATLYYVIIMIVINYELKEPARKMKLIKDESFKISEIGL